MTQLTEDLIAARSVIADASRWCQEAFALDADDDDVLVSSAGACKFCALGAVGLVTGVEPADKLCDSTDRYGLCITALENASDDLYQQRMVTVNDRRGRDAALKCFDKAIERAA